MAVVETPERPRALAETVPAVFFRTAARLSDRVALRRKRYGIWQGTTWREYADLVERAAHGLIALGLQPGERAAIIGENRPEWLIGDLAIQSCGAWPVGIYTTSSPEQVRYILDHSEARIFLVEGEEQLDKALAVRDRLPHLEHIVVMDPEGLRSFRDPMVVMWDEFLEAGASHRARHPHALEERIARISPEDPAVLIYTSGTTGQPKGAVLTHANVIWTCDALHAANRYYQADEVLSFLALAHIAERTLSVFLPIRFGITVNFIENLDTVLQNLTEVRPTVMFAVPRIWEKIHSLLTIHIAEADVLKRTAYRLGVRVGRAHAERVLRRKPVPAWLRLAYGLASTTVLVPLKLRLGLDRLRFVASGAAPIAPEVLWFFWSLGVPIREVYGQTEGCGPTTIHQGSDIKLGTVGKPLPGVEVRLAEDGEILVRGGNVFAGYFNDPEATAAALRDGWLHSGDVGAFDEDGFLRITDRKKDLLITAGGKNVAPQFIENKLKASPYINDAVVIGDGRRYLVALVMLDEENATKWAQDRRLPFTTYGDLAANPEVRRLIQGEVDAVNQTLSGPEQVKRFAILPKRLYAEDGEVTPTLKIKRKALMEKFSDLVEAMYR